MQNVKMSRKGSKLLVEIDLTQSISVATTGGNIAVPGDDAISIGINVYTPNGEYKKK